MSSEKENNIKIINGIINTIVDLMKRGEKVEMKHKLDFELTLEETKAILTKNIDHFSKITDENSSFFEIKKKLIEKLSDLQDKLSKLSLIIFCRSRAEKYLDRSRQELSYINMVLLSILNNNSYQIPPSQPKVEEKLYDEEILNLHKELMELKLKLKQNEKINLNLEKQNTSNLSLIHINKPVKEGVSNKQKLYNDGINYYFGIDYSINYIKAFEYFSSAASNKHPSAMFMLGKMLINGDGIEKNNNKGVQLIKEASDLGHSKSSIEMGILSEKGILCSSDKVALSNEQVNDFNNNLLRYHEIAFNYYYLSAYEQNSSEGYYILGNIFLNGTHGKNKDYTKAYEMYKKSIQIDNNLNANNALGNIYYKGDVILEKDYLKAFEKFSIASKCGNIDAINALALCYEYGNGTERNKKLAFELYDKAANKNHPLAITNKAIFLIKNNSYSDKSIYKEAYKLLLASTNLYFIGNKDGFYYLGFLYHNGFHNRNQIPDEILAYKMYLKAMKRGHLNAQTKIGFLLNKGIINYLENNEEEGIKLIQIAANKGDEEAINYIMQSSKEGETRFNMDTVEIRRLFNNSSFDINKTSDGFGRDNYLKDLNSLNILKNTVFKGYSTTNYFHNRLLKDNRETSNNINERYDE